MKTYLRSCTYFHLSSVVIHVVDDGDVSWDRVVKVLIDVGLGLIVGLCFWIWTSFSLCLLFLNLWTYDGLKLRSKFWYVVVFGLVNLVWRVTDHPVVPSSSSYLFVN